MKRLNGVLVPDDKDGEFFERNRDVIFSAMNLLNGEPKVGAEMVSGVLERMIESRVAEVLKTKEMPELLPDIIQTDNIGEVIEKLIIVHIRMWMLEDAIGLADDKDVADLKRKIDICFKQKRPRYVEAVNRMIDDAIISGKSLTEDSVKQYAKFGNR